MTHITARLLKILASIALIFPLLGHSAAPSFIGKMSLGFLNEPVCKLNDVNVSKSSVKGRGNLNHDESSISWTSTCVITLPQTVRYCVMASHKIESPDAFLSWYSGFQKKVLRAKIVSEADINPGFGKYNVVYYCFD